MLKHQKIFLLLCIIKPDVKHKFLEKPKHKQENRNKSKYCSAEGRANHTISGRFEGNASSKIIIQEIIPGKHKTTYSYSIFNYSRMAGIISIDEYANIGVNFIFLREFRYKFMGAVSAYFVVPIYMGAFTAVAGYSAQLIKQIELVDGDSK